MSIDTRTLVTGAKKYPVLTVSGIIVVVLVAVLYLRSDRMDLQQAEFDRLSAEAARYRANIINSAQLREQLDFLVQANNAVKDRAFKAESMALNLQYFYRLESETGVKYLDLRPGTRAPTPGKPAAKPGAGDYIPLTYVVNVQGDFAQIVTFLKRLEQGAYFCQINTAQATSTGLGVTLNLNLDLLGVQ